MPSSPEFRAVRNYFRSGWAFLIPYLAAYLLYAWREWPVNPGPTGDEVPCLLHVYWTLHGIHLVLAAGALFAWWLEAKDREPRHTGHAGFDHIGPILPWLCLALIFWIPGIYLEWPSDPWEHLRRINEWHVDGVVTAHSSWKKSSYFLSYSLTGHAAGLPQLSLLNWYYTGSCLLLCWQYYRLARAVGLGERASFLFVLLNAVTFGNNIFSFFRYYGLSSSVLAQLGAVALTRLAIEAVQGSIQNGKQPFSSLFPAPRPLLIWCTSSIMLTLLTAFNHIQGLGIAGLGIVAVVGWRLIAWRRAMIGWFSLGVLLLSCVALLWFPRNPALAQTYGPQHWMTLWYGFNMFSPASPAFERSQHILGIFGMGNLIAGIILAVRNHPAGWLTLSAPLMLIVPFTAMPFANQLIEQDTMLTFHRMLLAIPSGLAVICLFSNSARFPVRAWTPTAIIAIFGLVAIQPAHPSNNRFWNCIASAPADLTYRAMIEAYDPADLPAKNTDVVCTEPTAFILEATYQAPVKSANRTIPANQARSIAQVLGAPAVINPPNIRSVLSPSPSDWTSVSGILADSTVTAPSASVRRVVVQNERGQTTEILTNDAFPIERRRSYQIEVRIRTHSGSEGMAYLAIAWYDKHGLLLDAATPAPKGAGDPSGWRNGTYSYFGLVGEKPPLQWSTYRISFGAREDRAIPVNAAFARIGMILNSNEARDAVIQLAHARLWEKSAASPVSDGIFAEGAPLVVFIGNRMNSYSPGSQAGLLSGHWPAQQVALGNSGELEFETTLDGLPVIQKNGGSQIRISPKSPALSAEGSRD